MINLLGVIMKASRLRYFYLLAVTVSCLIATSCTSGPPPVRPGTPEFNWGAAKEMYRTGDYVRTNENLGRLIATSNEYTARAIPWRLIMTGGMAQGYMDLGEAYEQGARKNRANPSAFRRQVTVCRSAANGLTLQFAETMQQLLKSTLGETVTLDFDYPSGSANEPIELQKLTAGLMPQESEQSLIQKAMLQRGVLLAACHAVGATEDPAKAMEMFKAGAVQVPKGVFMLAMASALYDQSQFYTPKMLDDPRRAKLLCTQAQDALKDVAPSKESKALSTKIQNALKKLKVT